MKWLYGIPALALLVLLVDFVWLARLEYGGPPHVELMLEGEVPATFYLPPDPQQGPNSRWGLAEPTPGEKPAAVVLAHGFAGDRASLSTLARSMAHAGYAVLVIDMRGHGANRNSFARGRGTDAFLLEDIGTAVDFLRTSPRVDGNRIAVGGHSMGAGASLAYGGHDPGIDGLLLISGGWGLEGPHRPSNVLFLVAAEDPARIRERAGVVANQLAGDEYLEHGKTLGDLTRGSGVRLASVEGTGHVDIVRSPGAVAEVVGWLDAIYGVERAAAAPVVDARLEALGLGFLALLLVMPGIGGLVGRLSPHVAERPASGAFGRLAIFGAVLLFTLPLVALGEPGVLLGLAVADGVVAQFFYAGVILLAGLALGNRLGLAARVGRWNLAVAAAVVGMLAIYALLTPLGVAFHRMSLTPERALLGLLAALALFPFTLASNSLLRRGSAWVATLTVLLGRALLVVVLGIGIAMEIVPGVVALMLPMLAGFFVFFELVGVPVYVGSRNVVTVALLEALWLAWIFAAILPVRL